MNDVDPFQKSRLDRFDANVEFSGFKRQAEAKADQVKKDIPRFDRLEKYCNFFVMPTEAETVQFSFGNRLMGRRDLGGRTAFEHGLSLVYSIGPTGEVAVIIYPFSSTLGTVHEDHIFLALGRMSQHQLLSRLKKDLADLVAYGYVSSIDAAASWSEKRRINHLRSSRPMQIDGKFTPPEKKSKYVLPVVGWLTGMLVRGFVTALLKPLAILFLLVVAAYFGWDWLAKVK